MRMLVISLTREVTPEAIASMARGSPVTYARRSLAASVEKGAASHLCAQSIRSAAITPGTFVGKAIPIFIVEAPVARMGHETPAGNFTLSRRDD
jgi:hypothetical protein